MVADGKKYKLSLLKNTSNVRSSAGTLIKWRIFIGAKLNLSRNGYFLSPGRVQ